MTVSGDAKALLCLHIIICTSYSMCTSSLPDMYTRQSTSAHVITNMLHFQQIAWAYSTYTLKILIVIVGFYYDVGIMFCTL